VWLTGKRCYLVRWDEQRWDGDVLADFRMCCAGLDMNMRSGRRFCPLLRVAFFCIPRPRAVERRQELSVSERFFHLYHQFTLLAW